MKTLHLNASPRKENSRSLSLCTHLLEQLKNANPDMVVDSLNLFEEDLPEIEKITTEAKFETIMGGSPTNDSWDKVIKMSKDFASYDCYIIGAPMWNFSAPYKLKHYIDIVVQPGICFHYTEAGPQGLLSGKKMYIVTTHGGDYSQPPVSQMNFLEPYLRGIFGFIGISDIQVVSAQPLDVSAELTTTAMANAKAAINNL